MSLQPKFTPEPWVDCDSCDPSDYALIQSDNEDRFEAWVATVRVDPGCETSEHPSCIGNDEARANTELILLAPRMAAAIYELTQARKRSSQDFERRSYKKDIQSVMDAVSDLFEEV